ncbi:MAG TPA: bifunctional protein-serine/threonine kinase/phosphatase [Opitutaceae bacterium]|nr:bifunctional protein-serine/threonine kinase/phosphatase [Opitutaceae bacterium]
MGCSLTTATQPGAGRPRSDDACAFREYDGVLVAAMADGMGSARAGGEAADRATRRLVDNFEARPVDWAPDRALAEFATQINRQLCEEAVHRYGSEGALACTLAAVAVSGDMLWGVNLGDTEVLLWRDGRVRRLSERHALEGPERGHVLTRALGTEADVVPHAFSWRLAAGDRVLLCTDGVAAVLPPDRLAELLGRRADAAAIVRALGEPGDDASALVIDVAAPGASAATAPQLHVPATLRAGETWAGHVLARPLDPDGRVWLARRPGDGAERVLKFPPADARHDPHVRALFSREIAHARRLRAPFFPGADVPDEDPVSCYSLEYVAAPTLRECLRERPLATEEVIALGRFLAGAAQFLLRHDVVHGDIKPENILVRGRGAEAAFTLLDFGSVAPLFAPPSRAGTASYLAPERFGGAPHSERTELFGIGVTLFEAATRTYPYGEIERFQNPRFPAPKLPSRLNATLPSWLEAVLLRCVATEPARRYQHYSELAFDLEHPAKVEPFFAPDTPLFERHPLLFWQLTAAALAALNLVQLCSRP